MKQWLLALCLTLLLPLFGRCADSAPSVAIFPSFPSSCLGTRVSAKLCFVGQRSPKQRCHCEYGGEAELRGQVRSQARAWERGNEAGAWERGNHAVILNYQISSSFNSPPL